MDMPAASTVQWAWITPEAPSVIVKVALNRPVAVDTMVSVVVNVPKVGDAKV